VVAKHIAATLNCNSLNGACGKCKTCLKILKNKHVDIRIIRPESKSRQITIDKIRELERVSFLKPGEAKTKVGIIVDADRLVPAAQDAFLKTLEEPPKNTVFLLLTSEAQQLKPTIISRCLHLSLFKDETIEPNKHMVDIKQALDKLQMDKSDNSIFSTYRLIDTLQDTLSKIKGEVEENVKVRYKVIAYTGLESEQIKKIEAEKEAIISAGYRLERSHLINAVQKYFRDLAIASPESSSYIKAYEATEQMNRYLSLNINESLAIEVACLSIMETIGGNK
jgi:DNA polymerase III delta prime subunit